MSWVRVDDRFPTHPKAGGLSDAAMALWLRALCWARERGTPSVPASMLWQLSRARRPAVPAQELVASGLWIHDGDFYRIHDFAKYGPPERSGEEAEAEQAGGLSEAKKAAVLKAARASAEARRQRAADEEATNGQRKSNDGSTTDERSTNETANENPTTAQRVVAPPLTLPSQIPDPDPGPDPEVVGAVDPGPDTTAREGTTANDGQRRPDESSTNGNDELDDHEREVVALAADLARVPAFARDDHRALAEDMITGATMDGLTPEQARRAIGACLLKRGPELRRANPRERWRIIAGFVGKQRFISAQEEGQAERRRAERPPEGRGTAPPANDEREAYPVFRAPPAAQGAR
jgi:hypothetical protein